MQYFDLQVGDTIMIGDTRVVIGKKSGRVCRLQVEALPTLPVSVLKAPLSENTLREGFPALNSR